MGSKFLTLACFVSAFGAAHAQLPGIDAPTGAGVGSEGRSATEGRRDDRTPRGPVADQTGSGTLKNAIELCERLAGTEREICFQQARENRERAATPPLGATPGRGATGGGARSAPAPR